MCLLLGEVRHDIYIHLNICTYLYMQYYYITPVRCFRGCFKFTFDEGARKCAFYSGRCVIFISTYSPISIYT